MPNSRFIFRVSLYNWVEIKNMSWGEGWLSLYTGVKEVTLNDEQLAEFYESKECPVELLTNEYLIIKNRDDIVDKYRFNGEKLIKLQNIKFKNTNVLKPLDEIQNCAYDALLNNDIKVVVLIGKSGTGKTKSAISVGLELLKSGSYEKLLLVRHAVESGESIGLLPGSKEDKMIDGWAGCFYDNLPGNRFEFEELIKQGRIEMESLSLLKGRNLQKSIVIFDEAEDAYPEHVELVGSRINDNSKLIVVGDYKQVSKTKFKDNSGMLRLIDKAKGKDWFSCIELITNGRGKIAEFFSVEFKIWGVILLT